MSAAAYDASNPITGDQAWLSASPSRVALFAKYLRNEKRGWNQRIASLLAG
jgi:hypothetical protein